MEAVSRKDIGRLSVISATVGFSQSALLALVPIISERTGLGSAEIGMVAFLGTAAFMAAAPFWGHQGSQWRMRPFFIGLAALMILGHMLFAASLLAGSLSAMTALTLLAASRILYSLGAAGVMPHAQATVVGTTAEEARPAALSRLSAGLGVGRILGSLVALASTIGIALPLLAVIASPLLLLAAPDLGRPSQPVRRDKGEKRGLIIRSTAPILAVGFALTFGLGQIQIALGLFLLQRFGLEAHAAAALTGTTYAIVAVAMIAVQATVVPRLAYRLGRNMRLGVGGFALGCLVIAMAPAAWVVTLGAVVAAVGIAIATPAYTACLAGRTAAHRQASAAGWLASTHALGQGVGALCGGLTFAIWPALPFIVGAAVGGAMTLALFGLQDRPAGHETAS